MQQKPSIKLKADNKEEHQNDGHSALPENAKRKRAEECADDKGDDNERDPWRRGSSEPAQTGRQRGNNRIDYPSIAGLWNLLSE